MKQWLQTRRGKGLVCGLVWVAIFALVNYPIGAWAGQKLTPVIIGLPFSVFYFWAAYSLLIVAGIVIAWRFFRD